jgi:hypothetical protein
MWRLPEQGKDFRDCHHVLELFGGQALAPTLARALHQAKVCLGEAQLFGEACHRMRRPRTTRTAPCEAGGGANGHPGFRRMS